MRRPRITMHYNADKASAVHGALVQAGYDVVSHGGDVLLTDLTVRTFTFEHLFATHDRVVLYPHGPGPLRHLDGVWPAPKGLLGTFIVGEGAVEATRAAGAPDPIIAMGWPYCELRPFRPRPVGRVLLAVTHPDIFGYLPPAWKAANACALSLLVDLGLEVTVRYKGSLRENGIERRPGVRYQGTEDGPAPGPLEAVDAADLVVSNGTFGHMAVARGIPTIFYAQNVWNGDWGHPGQMLHTKHWPSYRHLYVYPYELLEDDPAELVRRACRSDEDIARWRERLIGKPFDAHLFAAQFAHLVGG